MKGPLFYSKILLFGEYGIIRDSKGLSIPYIIFIMVRKKEDNLSRSNPIKRSLETFCNVFRNIAKRATRTCYFWFISLKEDETECILTSASHKDGLLGSGALVAAIYDKYANHKTQF
jgi:mevalonate kinase